MSNTVNLQATEYVQAHGRKKRWQKIVTALASAAVFCTTYALIMPAVTQKAETYCGYEEHVHTDECYEQTLTLTCKLSEEGHEHSDKCYEKQRELICGLKDTDGHAHTDQCYEKQSVLICNKEEIDGHTHGEGCYEQQRVLICANTGPDHVHGDECYELRDVLVCGLAECEAHHHGDECYGPRDILVCGLAECEAHHHGDECYGLQDVLICELEEQEPHEHSDTCWESVSNKEKLVCGKEEHEHTLQCFSCPGADTETEEVWKKSFESIELSGKWNEDIIAIAKTQLGYSESTANYEVQEDGKTMKGITRYGQWYGIPYGDWCAMFCSFCIHYAGVENYPLDCGCYTWINTLDRLGLYHSADSTESYEPKPGDLVFFDFDWFEEGVERKADHVGLVLALEKNADGVPVKLTTIEGNYGDRVSRVEYLPDDGHILGFGEMIANPNYIGPNAVPEEIFPVPECDCGSINAELLGHSDVCARKAFVMTLCGEKSAEELHELWKELPEDARAFTLTYLSWTDQTKLAELNRLLASDPIETGAADGDISAAITGVFPANAVAALQNLDESSDELAKNYIENKLGVIGGGVFSGAIDIGLYENGEKLDLNGETVSVAVGGFDFGGLWGDDLLVKAYHLKDTDAEDLETLDETEPEIEILPAHVDDNGNIVFETDGFSVIYFTVDFHYIDRVYSLPGGESMLLSKLLAELGMDFDAALIESVEFSDSGLLDVAEVFGEDGETVTDWELTSLLPFGSQETLTVTFLNGQVLTLDVTDAAGDTYLRKVTSVSDFNTTGQYLIVYETGSDNYALTYRSDNGHRTAVTITADGALFTGADVTDSMKWTRTSNSGLRSVSNNSYYLNLNSYAFFNTTDRKMVFAYNNGTFTIRRDGGSWLRYGNNAFSADSGNSTGFVIYKIVDPPATNYAFLEGTDGTAGNTGENFYNLFDEDTGTKYCVPKPDDGKVTVYFKTRDDSRFIADSYALTTANDNAEYGGRLPDGWTLYGSNDENNWTVLDRVTDPGMEAVDVTEYEYDIDSPIGYTYYKIEFDVSNMIQFSELQLFGEYGGNVPPPPAPPSYEGAFEHNKYIDAFRDGADNPDTDLDDRARNNQLPAGDNAYDLYRLYLDMTGKQEPMDLLVVVDGSGSMDKTDMDGGMARDTAITRFLNGGTDRATSDGFISYFLGLNPENQVSVVQFYGSTDNSRDSHTISNANHDYTFDSSVLKNWTHSNAFVDCANKYNNGTNYEAGLKRATEMFSSVRNDGHRKIMLFMSDGVPTYFLIDDSDVGFSANNYTLRSTDTGKRWGTGSYTTASNYLNCKEPSKRAFDEFMAANPEVTVFTVGVSEDISATSQSESQSPEVLQYIATNGGGEFFSVDSNMDELKLRLESIFYPAGVTITDYLSKYVRCYGTDPDVLVTMTNKSNGRVTKLYENGAVTAAGRGILSGVTFTDIDSSEAPTGDYTGIVSAIFDPNYKFEPEYTYTLSFNVETTQTAYNEYAANLADGHNGYGGVTGDENTDYPGNTTSSEKPGFHSNLSATVSYKVSNVQKWEIYDDPVIQVRNTEIDVEKVWSDGADKHEDDSVEAELYMVNGTTERLIATEVLNKDNDWKATFEHLPSGNNTYKVIEKVVPGDYEVSYRKTDATATTSEKWTITNTRGVTEIKILKVDMTDRPITYNPAEFKLYTDETLEHQFGETYTTDDDGYITIRDLELNTEYYLKETSAPTGYSMMPEAAKFKVVLNRDNKLEIEYLSPQNQYVKAMENQLTLMVENPGGYELPQTGGIGLVPFYTFGTLLTAGALMYSHRKRRREGGAE